MCSKVNVLKVHRMPDIMLSVWNSIMYKKRSIPSSHGDTIYVANGITLLMFLEKKCYFYLSEIKYWRTNNLQQGKNSPLVKVQEF